ncbi:hypothetical protein FA13DRAFT_1808002 [Coprinellus micaceus]|uniref:Uncharacterized protein n=1 Tax=Coprinellus micaceus TaxID=71717 RepID=A0A4Y7U189_COPMI|nr:hypothetical protein FA13DRAFT_1808002 [Coprinellus micaceus]
MDSASSSNTRKRPRENETESQKIKREKAAERQRRKRERDRANVQVQAPAEPQEVQGYAHPQAQVPQVVVSAAGMGMLYAPPDQHLHLQHAMAHQLEQPLQAQAGPSTPTAHLTKDEQARREKVRMAARERQRKHRALVRDRKLREMGVDPNGAASDVSAAVDDALRYTSTDYIPHDLQHSIPLMEPPFPGVAQGLGGQTFASTLLLSFSSWHHLNLSSQKLGTGGTPSGQYSMLKHNGKRTHKPRHRLKPMHKHKHNSSSNHLLTWHLPLRWKPNLPFNSISISNLNINPNHLHNRSNNNLSPSPNIKRHTQYKRPRSRRSSNTQPPAIPQCQPSHTPTVQTLVRWTFGTASRIQLTRPMPSFSPSFGGDPTRANGTNSIPADSIDPHLTNGTSGKNS